MTLGVSRDPYLGVFKCDKASMACIESNLVSGAMVKTLEPNLTWYTNTDATH